MICARRVCLEKVWSAIKIKASNKTRDAKWTPSIALSVALLQTLKHKKFNLV